MSRRNEPLTPTGRLRMVLHHLDDGIPKAHVAAEFRVLRPTMSTWVTRYLAEGELGLTDRPSTPGLVAAGGRGSVIILVIDPARHRGASGVFAGVGAGVEHFIDR